MVWLSLGTEIVPRKPSSGIFVFRIRSMSRASSYPAELVPLAGFGVVSIWMLHMRSEERIPWQFGKNAFDVGSVT